MTLFADSWFFILFTILAIPAVILGILEKPLKYYSFAVSVVFLWLVTKSNLPSLIYLCVFCAAEFAVLKLWLYIIREKGRNSKLFWLFLLLCIAPLMIYKVCGQFKVSVFAFIGISYMTFKVVQIMIEIYDKVIIEISAFEYFSFLLFFPSILSGPIDRSRRYSKDLERIRPRGGYMEMAATGVYKMLTGVLYKFVLGAGVYQIMSFFGLKAGLAADLIYMYSYGMYLFFDFAGYSRMAIGAAYIFGVEMPENFNAPFKSKDIKDFWDRWHITLSHWFRDYLFSRLMMSWMKNKTFNNRLAMSTCGFMINMTVMGLWHGFDFYYILYGVYHGLLLSLTEIYQKKSKFYRRHKKDRSFIIVSTFITFNLVMFGLFIFSGRFTALLGIAGSAAAGTGAAPGHSVLLKYVYHWITGVSGS